MRKPSLPAGYQNFGGRTGGIGDLFVLMFALAAVVDIDGRRDGNGSGRLVFFA